MSNNQILNIFSSFMQCSYESVGPSVTYGSGVYKKRLLVSIWPIQGSQNAEETLSIMRVRKLALKKREKLKMKNKSSKCVNMFANFKHNILELIYPDITRFYNFFLLNTNTAFISKFYLFDSKGRKILKSSAKTKCKFGSLDSETLYIPLQLNVITDRCYKNFCSLING